MIVSERERDERMLYIYYYYAYNLHTIMCIYVFYYGVKGGKCIYTWLVIHILMARQVNLSDDAYETLKNIQARSTPKDESKRPILREMPSMSDVVQKLAGKHRMLLMASQCLSDAAGLLDHLEFQELAQNVRTIEKTVKDEAEGII